MLGFGLGHLHLSPAAFWAMTPIEFLAAMQALPRADRQPLARADLGRLMRAFPDKEDI